MAVSAIENLRFDAFRKKHLLVALSGGADSVALLHHEHTDTILCQRLEDAVVHTDYAHHTKTFHGNQACIVDGRNTLDCLRLLILDFLLDDGTRSFGIECILD